MEMKEARSKQKLRVFKGEEFNFQLLRALSCMGEKGAELGECLQAAAGINDGDLDSWVESFEGMAVRIESLARSCAAAGHPASARDAFLRASNYYRAAEYFSFASDPGFQARWMKSRDCFQDACRLMPFNAEPVLIPFAGVELPGYFFKPPESARRPTLMIHGGADSSGEELYFWCVPEALRRGYNALIFEGPGHRGAVHLHPELVERFDFEVPVAAAVDWLVTRPDVDPQRLALLGFSAGGYRCARAAAFERRLSAVILSAPIRDIHALVTSMFSGLLSKIPAGMIDRAAARMMRRDPLLRQSIEYWCWKNGIQSVAELLDSQKQFTLQGLEQNITCAVLSLVGEGEGRASVEQARRFHANIGSTVKELRVFTRAEGAEDHCQLNNHALRNQVAFDWLDAVLGMSRSLA